MADAVNPRAVPMLRSSCERLGGSFRLGAGNTVACDGLRSIVRGAWADAVKAVAVESGSRDRPSAIQSVTDAIRRAAGQNPALAEKVGQFIPESIRPAIPIIDQLTSSGGGMAGPTTIPTPGSGFTLPGGSGGSFGPAECKFPMVRIGDKCLNLAALPPGGTPAVTSAPGVAVMGAFGIPAIQPTVVGEINGSPVRRCPAGSVLGRDELCYWKGSIPRNLRKWPPPARPALTAQDVKTIRRADSLRGKVERLAKSVGACKTPRRRKR